MPNSPSTTRHTRLFELIRQQNLAQAACQAHKSTGRKEQTNGSADTLGKLLTRAHQSLIAMA
jgi:hypothetical protein